MMNLRSMRRALTTVVAIAALLSSAVAFSQTRGVAPEHRRAVVAVADYVSVSSGLTDRLLKSYGYTPPTGAADWRRAAPIRKLQLAYVAASNADKVHGGDRLLALLAQDLAQRYDSVQHGPLASYVSRPRYSVHFANPAVLPPIIDLPPAARSALRAAAEYCTQGLNPARILVEDLGVPTDDEAQDLLARSNTIEDAFTEALSRHDSAEQRKHVAAIAKRLDEKYGTAQYDRRLAPYLTHTDIAGPANPDSFQPPSPRGPAPNGPSGGGGGGGFPHSRPPAPTRSAESTFTQARESWVAKSVPVAFESAAIMVEGAGGILFGNSVHDTGLPQVTLVAYTPSRDATGDVLVTFADGSRASFPYVSADEAHAAKAVVFDRAGALKSDPTDAAIPLVSMRANLDYSECDAEKKEYDGIAFDMVVHPALARSDLGWSAIIVDMYPTIIRAIHDQRREMKKSAAPLPTFVRDLRAHHAYNWKIVDVPVLIEREGERLTVQRDPRGDEFPEGLRRTAFLEMRPFYEKSATVASSGHSDETKPDLEFAHDFYAQLPLIMRQIPEYQRINSFAEVLALFRWAKAKGGKFDGIITAPKLARAPEAIAVVRGSIKPIAPPSELERAFRMIDRCEPDEP
jgi:hypothetical protein